VGGHAHAAEWVHVHDLVRDRVLGHYPERANDVHRPARRAALLKEPALDLDIERARDAVLVRVPGALAARMPVRRLREVPAHLSSPGARPYAASIASWASRLVR
jgi:hypothetical protein